MARCAVTTCKLYSRTTYANTGFPEALHTQFTAWHVRHSELHTSLTASASYPVSMRDAPAGSLHATLPLHITDSALARIRLRQHIATNPTEMGIAGEAEALLVIPNSELHLVEDGVQRLLSTGPFMVSILGDPSNPEGQKIQAAVGSTTWLLGKHLPALKAADTIYSFGLEQSRATYYCLVLPSDTPADALDAVYDVLSFSSALSTVRQVDAAAQEADKLAGSPEAKLLQQPPLPTNNSAPAALGTTPTAAAAAAAGPSGRPGPYPYDLTAGSSSTAAAAAGAAAAPAVQATGPPGPYPTNLVSATAPPAPPAPAAAAPPGLLASHSAPAPATAPPQIPSCGNPTADKVAAGLIWGSSVMAAGVTKAAVATQSAIQGYVARQTSQPKLAGQPVKVSPAFRASLAVVGKIASGAAYVTGKLAGLVGAATYATALAIAKMLPGHSAKKPSKDGEVSSEERTALKTVGAAGLVAYVQVYDALEGAAKQVAASSATATQHYIHYKYGEEAGQLAVESMPAAQDMMQACLNCTRLGARSAISKTAKKTSSVYLKSTLAGVTVDDQAKGVRVPQAAP